MAKLPKAIQDEVDQAEAIEKAFADSQTPPTAETAPVEVGEAQTAATLAPEVEAQPQPPQADDPNSETWQQRYRVLQGKYDRDVPTLHMRVKDLEAQLSQLTQRLESQPAEAPHVANDATPEDVETFGEDLVNLMRRVAAAEAARKQAETLDRVGRVENSLQLTAEERFYANLSARVPNWKDIDNDQGWLSWLGEYDPMAGATRQDALSAAAQSGDADRVASIFETYIRNTRPVSAPQAVSPGNPSLQAQVVPRGQGSQGQSTQQKKVYTTAEIQQLLDPRNILRLPEDQQRAIERDIDLAVAEGRIAA